MSTVTSRAGNLFDASRKPAIERLESERMVSAAKKERHRRRIDALNAKMASLRDPGQLERSKMPIVCGVYFLYREGTLIYVGQSINVHSRVWQHRHTKQFDEFSFIRCDEDHLDVLESVYIRKLNPKLNKVAPLTAEQLDLMGVSCWVEWEAAA